MQYIVMVAATLILVGLDQLFKYIVASNMEVGSMIPAIKGLLNWRYLENEGASFSILEGARWFFVVGTILIIAAIVFFIARKKIYHFTGKIASVLIVSGGIGNLIDRIRMGKVIDYIDISPLFRFPVFNFADCCIVVGGIILVIYVLFLHDQNAPKELKEEAEQASEENA